MQGTLEPDGTLELDEKVFLPPGRVLVKVQAASPLVGRNLLETLQNIWADQKARGDVPRSKEEIDADLQQMRDEWEERLQELEHRQEGCCETRIEAPFAEGPLP